MFNHSTIRHLYLVALAILVMGRAALQPMVQTVAQLAAAQSAKLTKAVALQPVAQTVAQPAAAQSTISADVVALLRQASYPVDDDTFGTVTLVHGKFEGKPYVEGGASQPTAGLIEDAVASGDLNGDGHAEAVATVWTNGGGSGSAIYLAVMALSPDNATALATTLLGDHVKVKKVAVVDGKIGVTLVQPGEDEAPCCGTETVEQEYTLKGNTLSQTANRVLIPVIAERLSNATYTIPLAPIPLTDNKPVTVQLKQGRWEGQPAQGDNASRPVVTLQADIYGIITGMGDLNGDGVPEILAVVNSNFGGSGVFPHIVIMTQGADGSLTQLATVALEDRTQVQALWVDDGKVQVQALTHSDTDPLCCPSQFTTLSFTLQDIT